MHSRILYSRVLGALLYSQQRDVLAPARFLEHTQPLTPRHILHHSHSTVGGSKSSHYTVRTERFLGVRATTLTTGEIVKAD